MIRSMVMIALLLFTAVWEMDAQTDSVPPTELTLHPRHEYREWILGMSISKYGLYPEYNGNPIPNGEASIVRYFATAGYGAHIPMMIFDGLYGIWLVPSGLFAVNLAEESYDPETDSRAKWSVDISIPVHVTFGRGTSRATRNVWGLEGGIGLNVGYRSRMEAFTVSPSAMVDLTYAPRGLYRLRFMTDILPGSLGENASYRVWTLAVVIGMKQ